MILFSLLLISFLFLPLLPGAKAEDADNDGLSDDLESTLAERHAPILYFEEEERFFPVMIEYHLQNSNLNQSRGGDDLTDPSPTSSKIGNYTDPDGRYYLDNRKGGVGDDGVERDYRAEGQAQGYTIYSHVARDSYHGNEYIVVQYWMFYAFNKGTMNTHEGDWEMVQVVLNHTSHEPEEAMYSQHIGGQRTKWSNIEKDGGHIKVYVAKGSHANYFRSYQGKLSLASDVVSDNGRVLKPKDYSIVLLGEAGESNHTVNQSWLDFAGRWGEFGSEEDELRGKRGPHGPVYREEGEMWHTPLAWGRGLQSVDPTIFKINWFFYNFLAIFLTIALLSISLKMFLIYRGHKRIGLGKRVFSLLYIDGLNLKSIGNAVTIFGMAVAILSLFYPWYGVSVDIDAGSYRTDGMIEVVSIDGSDGVRVNKLESNSGLVQVFAFPIPFSVIIGLAIFNIVLSSVGIQKSSKLGRKYLWGGIKLLIPIIIILIFVARLTAILAVAPVEMPEESEELVETVADSPAGGEETKDIGDYGTVDMKWGLEKGGICLLASGILLLLGGVMEIFAKQDLFQAKRKDTEGEEKLDDIRERIEGLELALAQEKEDKIEETTQEALEKKHS